MCVFWSITKLDGNVYIHEAVNLRSCRDMNSSTWASKFNQPEMTACLIAHCRNVRGLGKSVVVRLFEKLRHSDERSTKFESPNHD